MKRLLITLGCLCAILLLTPVAHAEGGVEILDNRITFTEPLIAGETARVYAALRNTTETDVTGAVTFKLGGQVIGSSPISLKTNGAIEEVFTDFTVPDGPFNIQVTISDVDPIGTPIINNNDLSALIEPETDQDGDGIDSVEDNCPETANPGQEDLDRDGVGDACDNDIDGDGISNSNEESAGTNPENPDTDGDGVSDAIDNNPTGEPEVVEEPEETPDDTVRVNVAEGSVAETGEAASTTEESSSDREEVEASESGELEESKESEEEPQVEELTTRTSDDVPLFGETQTSTLITARELAWGSYQFEALTPRSAEQYRYQWQFGDNTTSTRREVSHVYTKAGRYTVELTVTDADGFVRTDQLIVDVPFFSLDNPTNRMLLVFLALLLLIGFTAWVKLARGAKR